MISFSSAVGNLFNRLGRLGKVIDTLRSYQGSQLTNFTDTTVGVVAQFNSESDIQALMGAQYITQLGTPAAVGQLMVSIAGSSISRAVYRDNPLFGQTLQTVTVSAALQEVIRQMGVQGATIPAITVTAIPRPSLTPSNPFFNGTGNGIVVMSTKRASDGATQANAFSETLTLVCSQDSYIGNATPGNERFALTGVGSVSSAFAFNWPGGSNASTSLSAIDGNTSNGSGNFLTNSGFEAFTANLPNNWHLTVGVAGVNIFEEDSIVYDPVSGGKALRITGDAPGTNVTLQQQFAVDTPSTLSPLTQYACNLFMRRDGTIPGAGVLTVELVDGNGVQIQDAAGNANFFIINLTQLTTTYAAYNGCFRLPLILPSAMYLQFRLSTALTNGRSVYVDKAALGLTTLAYVGGPSAAVFSGSILFIQGDYAYVDVVNQRGSGGSLNTWQTVFDVFFGTRASDILLPSSAVPTISDSLLQ